MQNERELAPSNAMGEPTTPGSSSPSWRWLDVWLVLALFAVSASIVAIGATALLDVIDAPLPVATPLAVIIGSIYLLLIMAIVVVLRIMRRVSWAELGLQSFSSMWVLLLPGLFTLQLSALLVINWAVSLTAADGVYENPQITALEEALRTPDEPTPSSQPSYSQSGEETRRPTPTAAAQTQVTTATIQPNTGALSGSEPSISQDTQFDALARNVELTRMDLWLLLATIGVLAPFSEELFFRGVLYPLQRRNRTRWLAILINALLFSIVHFIPLLIPALFVIGLMLAWLRERSNSIWPSFLLHMLQNSMAVMVIYGLANRIVA